MTTTTTTNITLSEAFAARTAKHNEAITLLAKIEAEQTIIEDCQKRLSGLNTAVTYYRPVADNYTAQIEQHAAIRNDAVNQYQKIMWSLYKAELPLISNTGIQEIAITLYSAQTAQA